MIGGISTFNDKGLRFNVGQAIYSLTLNLEPLPLNLYVDLSASAATEQFGKQPDDYADDEDYSKGTSPGTGFKDVADGLTAAHREQQNEQKRNEGVVLNWRFHDGMCL